MRAIAVIQARLSSIRLPGKVLMDIEGQPMLARVVERVSASRLIEGAVVATSSDDSDDRLASYCRANGIRCHRGPLDDVLTRFVQAGRREGADVIVRITADCPLIDPALIDAVITIRDAHRADYASNVVSRRYPRGLDVEVFTAEALARADREGQEPHHREHVTPYLYEQPGRFQVVGLDCERDLSAHRWTVDTEADLDLVRGIQHRLENPRAGWREVLAVVEREPNLARRNAHIRQKPTRAA